MATRITQRFIKESGGWTVETRMDSVPQRRVWTACTRAQAEKIADDERRTVATMELMDTYDDAEVTTEGSAS